MLAVQDLRRKAVQRQVQHIADAFALGQHSGNGGHGLDVGFQPVDLVVGGAGQQLDDKAARTLHGQVPVDQHAQRADGGHLLADGKILGDILGDLAGDQRHLADVRLPHPQIADDVQRAVASHRAAHIQMAVGAGRKLHHRVLHIALDVAAAVRDGQQPAGGAAALDLQRDGIPTAFQHHAHHRGGGQQAAQRGRGDGAGLMVLLRLADDLGGIDAVKHDAAIFRDAPQQVGGLVLFFSHTVSSCV